MSLPVLVLFALALVWALFAASAQIQCVDAARAGARAAARQDPPAAVTDIALAAAPRGARVTVGREGDHIRVKVAAKPPGAGPLPFEVGHEAVALAEDQAEPAGDQGEPAEEPDVPTEDQGVPLQERGMASQGRGGLGGGTARPGS